MPSNLFSRNKLLGVADPGPLPLHHCTTGPCPPAKNTEAPSSLAAGVAFLALLNRSGAARRPLPPLRGGCGNPEYSAARGGVSTGRATRGKRWSRRRLAAPHSSTHMFTLVPLRSRSATNAKSYVHVAMNFARGGARGGAAQQQQRAQHSERAQQRQQPPCWQAARARPPPPELDARLPIALSSVQPSSCLDLGGHAS